MMLRVRKGDQVIVVAGKDKGKKGEILGLNRDASRVIVGGVSLVKKHQKQKPGFAGGIVTKEDSIHISNVMCCDPSSGQPTRVGFKYLEDGRKVRYAKKSGEVIDR